MTDDELTDEQIEARRLARNTLVHAAKAVAKLHGTDAAFFATQAAHREVRHLLCQETITARPLHS
jgi:hypothetical protein